MAKRKKQTDETDNTAAQCPNCGYIFNPQTGERADEHAPNAEPAEGEAEDAGNENVDAAA